MGPSPQNFSKRTSSLATQAVLTSLNTNIAPAPSLSSAGIAEESATATPVRPPTSGSMSSASSQQQQQQQLTASLQESNERADALLLELVNAKTAEAVARQELEEMRGKFEAMRKLLGGGGLSPGSTSGNNSPATTPGVSGHKASPSEGFMSFVSGAAGAARDRVVQATTTASAEGKPAVVVVSEKAPVAAAAAAGGKAAAPAGSAGWGGWGWGKRVVS
jgi:hypothetical protein